MTTPTTIFKFYYKDHLVRGLVKDGKGYLLGPDIMPLFGYKKRPLVDINWLLDKGSDKEFIYGVPVISLCGVCFLETYPRIKRKKAQEVSDWVDGEVMPILEGRANLPDDVRTESWKEEDFRNYYQEACLVEDTGTRSGSKKTVIARPLYGKTAVKVKIDTSLCSVHNAIKEILLAVIAKENGGEVDCVKAAKALSQLSELVMAEAQESLLLQMED